MAIERLWGSAGPGVASRSPVTGDGEIIPNHLAWELLARTYVTGPDYVNIFQ